MKARIKFQKYGAMKFIGHLDVMRYFQKACRRAGIDNEYSKGYSPHQIMSFAAPLGVGLTSDGEYLDVQLLSSDEPSVMIERLNQVLTEGFKVTNFIFLKEREENKKKVTAMSLVDAADYLVSFKDGYEIDERIATPELFQKEFEKYLNQEIIVVSKKTKTQEVEVDIKPFITKVAFDSNSFEIDESSSMADVYENGIKVYLQLATGSVNNLKPELVMEEFLKHLGIEFQSFAWQMHRFELYTRDEESKALIPLDQLER